MPLRNNLSVYFEGHLFAVGYERFMNRESRNRLQFRVLGGIGIDFSRFQNHFIVLVIPFLQKNLESGIQIKKESFTA